MKITFSDFWQYPKAFDPNNNFFIHIIRDLFEDVEVVEPEDADVMFFSLFGNENGRYKDCKKIYLIENSGHFDLSIFLISFPIFPSNL